MENSGNKVIRELSTDLVGLWENFKQGNEMSRKGGLSTATCSREVIQIRIEGPLIWD